MHESTRLAADVAEIATESSSLAMYRRETLELLRRRVGFDLGTLHSTRAGATGLGFATDDGVLTEIQATALLEFTPLEIERISRGRTWGWSEVFPADRWDRLIAFGMSRSTSALVGFAAYARLGAIGFALARAGRGRPYTTKTLACLDAIAPVVTIAECLHNAQVYDPILAWAEDAGLTRRQSDVVGLVIRGLHNAEIATVLGCSELTVRNHLVAVFRKAGVTNRSELAFQSLTHARATSHHHGHRGHVHFDQYALGSGSALRHLERAARKPAAVR